MTYIKSYKELVVWQKSIELVKEIYLLTKVFPSSEIYGLTSQMRRAAVSIPSNIAEGYGRRSLVSSTQFYTVAYGSALELETQLIIAKDLKLADNNNPEKAEALLIEVCKMLNAMIIKMKQLEASS